MVERRAGLWPFWVKMARGPAVRQRSYEAMDGFIVWCGQAVLLTDPRASCSA